MSDWMRCMRRGEFEAAWRISDQVLRSRAGQTCWHLPRHLQWVWDGTPLDGKRVLVRCYHGLGDTIQFLRFLPLLKQIAAEVIVWAQPELIPLVRNSPGIDHLLPLHNGSPDVAYEADVEIMELAHVFRTTLRDLPVSVPYLHVEPARLPNDGNLAVGLVWRAGDWDERRNVPFSLLAPWAELPGITWHILQRGPGLAMRDPEFGLLSGSDSILEAARVMRSLDLVISVDSLPAHLAGALGVPVWTLLRAQADWRWMDRTEESPWYPTMRLFRQERDGEWEPVLERIVSELSALNHRRSKRTAVPLMSLS